MKRILLILLLAVPCAAQHAEQPQIIRAEPIQAAPDTLTDWQMLQLAIIMTESKGNPDARGTSNDLGVLQITPIFVKEANRIAGTDYTHEDAFDIAKSLEMFSIIQDHYNPGHSTEKAIHLHNPGGASIGYEGKVKANLQLIRMMEEVRKQLVANRNWER